MIIGKQVRWIAMNELAQAVSSTYGVSISEAMRILFNRPYDDDDDRVDSWTFMVQKRGQRLSPEFVKKGGIPGIAQWHFAEAVLCDMALTGDMAEGLWVVTEREFFP